MIKPCSEVNNSFVTTITNYLSSLKAFRMERLKNIKEGNMRTDYDKMFDDAEKDGKVEKLSSPVFKFEKPGDRITGLILGRKNVKGKGFGSISILYLIDTNDGETAFFLGGGSDKLYEDKLVEGVYVRVTFTGKKDIGKNRSVNTYDVKRFELQKAGTDGKK